MAGPTITLIAAVASNGVIGNGGGLVFKLPGDLPRFKQLTLGKPVIMGRKTWESLPLKPLPGRANIILTRDTSFTAQGALVAHDVNTALSHTANTPEVVIIGGGEVYKLFIPLAHKLELTEVHAPANGDTSFPTFIKTDWHETSRLKNEKRGEIPAFDYVTYERLTPAPH